MVKIQPHKIGAFRQNKYFRKTHRRFFSFRQRRVRNAVGPIINEYYVAPQAGEIIRSGVPSANILQHKKLSFPNDIRPLEKHFLGSLGLKTFTMDWM